MFNGILLFNLLDQFKKILYFNFISFFKILFLAL